MKHFTASTLALCLLIACGVAAQQRPNFSGRWISVSPGETPGLSQVVTHDAATLTVSHGAEAGTEHRQVFILDGKEHKNVMPSHGSEIVTLYTATWKGEALTIASKSTYPNGNTLDQMMIWSMDPQGQLIIDLAETYTGKPKTTVRLVHKKQ